MSFTIIIPARYGSVRLPGKPLLDIHGKPLIQHVYEVATTTLANLVVIATDDLRIKNVAQEFGAEVILTSKNHMSGTDRIAEAASILGLSDDEIIVNVQGDEYGLSAATINQVATLLAHNRDKDIATISESLSDVEQLNDQNLVKVVVDINNTALYFSRSPIPWSSKVAVGHSMQRHVGLYAYTAKSLQAFTRLSSCTLEQSESLEQLRALYHGWKIHVEAAIAAVGIGVDVPADLEKIDNLSLAGN